jgi:hypothetical protein
MPIRWPWRRPEYDEDFPYIPGQRKPKQRETLSQTAERIIQKKMKADPEYGLRMAEKVKNLTKDEKSLADQINELKDIQELLSGLGSNEKGGLLRDILGVLPELSRSLPQIIQMSQAQQPLVQRPQPPAQFQIQEPLRPQLTEQPPQTEQVVLGDLIGLLDETPEEAIILVKEQYPTWFNLLKSKSYEDLLSMLEPFKSNPEFGGMLDELLSQKKVWLRKVVALAHEEEGT